MLKYIFKKVGSNKNLAFNTLYLTIIQCVNIVIPIVAIPYLFNVIGTEKYGLILFAQSIVAYFIIIVNFGFDISAVKEIAENRENKNVINEIISLVYIVKFILFFVASIIYAILIYYVPIFHDEAILFYIVYGSVISEILFPIWYYQGVEKMRSICYIRVSAIILYVVLLFIMVRDVDDYLNAAFAQVFSLIASSIVGFIVFIRTEKVKLILPNIEQLASMFRSSFPFFISRASLVINSNIAATISGVMLSMEAVAILSLGQKIISFTLTPILMFQQAIFPRNSSIKNVAFSQKACKLTIIIALVEAVFIYFLTPTIVTFFLGKDVSNLQNAIFLVRLLLLQLVAMSASTYLGTPVLVAFGFSKPFNMSVVFSMICTLLFYGFIYFLKLENLFVFAIGLIISELLILGYRFYYCKKYSVI